MRKLILKMSMTVDGFVAGPKNESEWLFANTDPSADEWSVKTAWHAGAHVMGANTFRDMAGWWPSSSEIFAPPMNAIPKIVFSKDASVTSKSKWTKVKSTADSTKEKAGKRASASVTAENEKSWADARVMSGDLAKDIAKLKSEPGNDLIAWGGVKFAQSLVKAGLVDEVDLTVYPVAIGRGLSPFSELSKTMSLELKSSQAFSKGVVAHVYRVKSKK
ncbi:MAG TPA: dihydrofolate reductase family protein [Gemmatimonadaceae bacterium]|nr:dihydrofolate reductase family protein [Gemmatimonadaceae bacterium]